MLHGQVVRGVGGRRSEYRPIVSRLTSSTDPVEVARALIEVFHPSELYLADLDAITGGRPDLGHYRAVRELGPRLWVDAGVHGAQSALQVADTGCDVVAGLETVPSADVLRDIVSAVGVDRVVFSFDLRDGVPLNEWPGVDPIATVVAAGVTRLIVLDVARVGLGSGTGTGLLCRQLATTYPHLELITGGGILGSADLERLATLGVSGVLVASALHDGRISPDTVSRLSK